MSSGHGWNGQSNNTWNMIINRTTSDSTQSDINTRNPNQDGRCAREDASSYCNRATEKAQNSSNGRPLPVLELVKDKPETSQSSERIEVTRDTSKDDINQHRGHNAFVDGFFLESLFLFCCLCVVMGRFKEEVRKLNGEKEK